jgi:hypothetical protein
MEADVINAIKEVDTIGAITDNLFATVSAPAKIDEIIAEWMRDAEKEVTIAGHRLKDADKILDEVELAKRRIFDEENVAKTAQDVSARARKIAAELDAHTAAARTLKPRAYSTTTDQLLARTVTLLEQDRFCAKFASRTFEDLTRYYSTTTDEDTPDLVAFIEQEAAEGWPTIRVKPAGTAAETATAMRRLTEAIDARKAARVPDYLKAARAKLDAVLDPVRRGHLKMMAEGKTGHARQAFKPRTAPRTNKSDMALSS